MNLPLNSPLWYPVRPAIEPTGDRSLIFCVDFLGNNKDQIWGAPGSFVRASEAYYSDPSLTPATTNTPRFESYGLLHEGACANLYPTPLVPANQTIDLASTGSYTLSIYGAGSIAIAANTATITGEGSAIAGTPVTINCTGTGTVDVTVTGSPDKAQLEKLSIASAFCNTTRATEAAYPQYAMSSALQAAVADEGAALVWVRPGFACDDMAAGTTAGLISCHGYINSLLFLGRGGDGNGRIAYSYDGTTTSGVQLNWAANTGYWIAVRWNKTTSKKQVGYAPVSTGVWTWGTEIAFDGAFSTDNVLRIGYGNEWPLHIKNIKIWNRDIGTTGIERMAVWKG